MKSGYFSGLFPLLDLHCTGAQIRTLMQKYKHNNVETEEAIRSSGKKAEILDNLRLAVGEGHIPKSEIYELLQNSEENGRQRIFYLKASEKGAKACQDGAEIAQALFDEQWGPDHFPVFARKKKSLDWSDFRLKYQGKKYDWLGKLYGHEQIERIEGKARKEETATGFRIIRNYTYVDYSTVLVARWNNPDLLEIRIDQLGLSGRSETLEERYEKVWSKLDKAINRSEFTPWNLSTAITAMIKGRKGHEGVYEVGMVTVRDSKRGDVEFRPYHAENIDVDAGRSSAIDELLKKGGAGKHVALLWKKDADGKDIEAADDDDDSTPAKFRKKGLLTIVTGDHSDQLMVRARTSAKLLDYVTNQLRTFSKPAT